jgi:hydroxyethylthiazole kinase-like uncharacterized protein yjeF
MKIFNAKQLHEADRFTIKNQRITSEALMERAALQLFNWLHLRLEGAPVTIRLFCGIGNNGGDGMALARHLLEHGYHIKVYVVNYSDKRSVDFLTNLDRVKERKLWPEFLEKETALPAISEDDIIVDAIFGTGLNRAPTAWVAKLIRHLNSSGAFILSVDVPSGLYLDRSPDHKAIITAGMVLSFQVPKLIFFLPETGIFSENWELLDIGLDEAYLDDTATTFELIGRREAITLYRPRQKFTHKGSYGHTLIIGGSRGKIGAVRLAAGACLRAGSGLVTAFVPGCGLLPLQSALPEIMVQTDEEEGFIGNIGYTIKPSAVGIGIGMGTSDATATAFAGFLKSFSGPLVVDADGLNILATHRDLLQKLPAHSILTPHRGELERLLGPWKDDFDLLDKAMQFSAQYKLVLHIKGAHSITLFEGRGYVNSSGNQGMATAGSGDVLTGIIAGLLGQGYGPLEAAVLGAYLHGKAGDLAAEKRGMEALVAGEISEAIGPAYKSLNDEGETRDDHTVPAG